MTAPARPRESSPVTARPVTPVSILSASLEALYDELLAVDAVLADKLHGALVLARGLDPYLEQCTTPESPALQQLAERTRHHDWRDRPSGAVPLEQEMLSGHVEGQFLKMLVHAVQARRVLEIGMFTGYSALAMAEALPADGVVIACEVDDQVAAFASSFLAGTPAGRKVQVRRGPALRTLRQLAEVGETFDLVNYANPVGEQFADTTANSVGGKNITSLEVEVPIKCLVHEADPVVGAWTTASSVV